MLMPAFAIRTQYLTRDFGAVRAVNHLDLEVPSGTVFGFLGPNGSGKTTTIRLLLGLLAPTDGRAEVLGLDIRSDAAKIRERCGALLVRHGLGIGGRSRSSGSGTRRRSRSTVSSTSCTSRSARTAE